MPTSNTCSPVGPHDGHRRRPGHRPEDVDVPPGRVSVAPGWPRLRCFLCVGPFPKFLVSPGGPPAPAGGSGCWRGLGAPQPPWAVTNLVSEVNDALMDRRDWHDARKGHWVASAAKAQPHELQEIAFVRAAPDEIQCVCRHVGRPQYTMRARVSAGIVQGSARPSCCHGTSVL